MDFIDVNHNDIRNATEEILGAISATFSTSLTIGTFDMIKYANTGVQNLSTIILICHKEE